MCWFAGTGTAQQIISTAKLPVLPNILKKSMFTKDLALILSRDIKQFTNGISVNQSMNVQNQSSRVF